MRRTLLLVVVGLVAVLAVPASALGAYVPRMVVSHETGRTGQQSATTLRITVPQTDDATAKIQIFLPLAYTLTLNQPPGTVIGGATAQVLATQLTPPTIAPLEGPIRTDDPARHVSNTCAPGLHQAVWLAELTLGGQGLQVPIYVDPVTQGTPMAQIASYQIQVCFGSPDRPVAAGGAPLGAKVLNATLNLLQSVTTTPPRTAQNAWRGVFTPWTPGPAGAPSASTTVEARAVVGLPKILTLVVRTRGRTVVLSGQLTEGGSGLARRTVEIWRAGNPRGRPPYRMQRFVRRTTNARGFYTHTIRFKRAGFHRFQVRASVPERDLGAAGCAGTSIAPAGCVSATAAAFRVQSATTRLLRIR